MEIFWGEGHIFFLHGRVKGRNKGVKCEIIFAPMKGYYLQHQFYKLAVVTNFMWRNVKLAHQFTYTTSLETLTEYIWSAETCNA